MKIKFGNKKFSNYTLNLELLKKYIKQKKLILIEFLYPKSSKRSLLSSQEIIILSFLSAYSSANF